ICSAVMAALYWSTVLGQLCSKSRLSEEFLSALKKTFAHRGVFIAAKRGELLELSALLWIQARWHLDNQPRKQITVTASVYVRDAFATQFEHLPALRASGDFKMGLAFESRHVNFAAQGRN